MITVRRSSERGKADLGWLKTQHTFSFGSYYDPRQMGFRSLRVINEDYVQPEKGFETHGHENMEIISYVFQGAIEHRDSGGNRSVLRAGEVQRMTAGTGVTHSEHNPLSDEILGFFQIWIEPWQTGLEPEYETIRVDNEQKRGKLRLLVSPEGGPDVLKINQDARIYASLLAPGEEAVHRFATGRYGWVQLLRGSLSVDRQTLEKGDGAAIGDMETLKLSATQDAEFLVIDLP